MARYFSSSALLPDAYYLGLDLSTQQLKGIVVDSGLKQIALAKVEFEVDLPAYKTVKGVFVKADTNEVLAPVAMWLDAVDLLFARLKDMDVDLARLRGVSGACQQHGSVYWNEKAAPALAALQVKDAADLAEQLKDSFAWDMSPNWQDHSTEQECRQFEACVGGPERLAEITGSKAHHRFTGPQILKLKHRLPQCYESTTRISLVSSFLASVLAGKLVDVEVSDACGMNLWDVTKQEFNSDLLGLFGPDADGIRRRLGPVNTSNAAVGSVSPYFVEKYGVSSDCKVIPFTGDNPGTILSLPLHANDVIISLGTSTTALVVTQNYVPSPLYHLFAHPVVPNSYMGMLCYCNGSLAREKVRDEVNSAAGDTSGSWDRFNAIAEAEMAKGTILGSSSSSSSSTKYKQIGFFFPLPEIIPSVRAQQTRLILVTDDNGQQRQQQPHKVLQWENSPAADVLGILESQGLSIRSRLAPMLTSSDQRPRRIYFVGGASANKVICEALSRVLVPSEGAYRVQDMKDACAVGAAAKAVYSVEGGGTKSWEDFIEERTDYGEFAEVFGGGLDGTTDTDLYKDGVEVFKKCEEYCFQ